MAMQPIPTSPVTCSDGTTDTFVGLNPNTDPNDKVQAFVNCFSSSANDASSLCLNLPPKLILAQWGGESGWATGNTQKTNQNWANLSYTNKNNPPGNEGSGVGGWAKFCGRAKHAFGYANFFHKDVNPIYSELIDYLSWCQLKGIIPSEYTCARFIADAGYGGSDHDGYYNKLVSWMDTLCSRSDFC